MPQPRVTLDNSPASALLVQTRFFVAHRPNLKPLGSRNWPSLAGAEIFWNSISSRYTETLGYALSGDDNFPERMTRPVCHATAGPVANRHDRNPKNADPPGRGPSGSGAERFSSCLTYGSCIHHIAVYARRRIRHVRAICYRWLRKLRYMAEMGPLVKERGSFPSIADVRLFVEPLLSPVCVGIPLGLS